jgi:uncharacterized protein
MRSIDIILPLSEAEDDLSQRVALARCVGCRPDDIVERRLLKRSLDARQKAIKVNLRFEVALAGERLPPLPCWRAPARVEPPRGRVLIVGSGPGGMFAALRCLELGYQPVVLERGKDASARRFDLAPLLRRGEVIEDSNYCFGEGGAGTFSDGKLYTRATKRGPVRKVYEILVAHGAPPAILIEAHPHIGSNLLPNVVKAIRQTILDGGGEVHFGARVDKLLREDRGRKLVGVGCQDGRELLGEALILATGHSARDVYRLLIAEKLQLEAKPFAVGVRIEHPQGLVDASQYHLHPGEPRPHNLPAASYRLATKLENRGVHSFCMCPGGFIVPAATENDEVVVNGMSLSRRDSPFANSGLVVTVEPEDVAHLEPEFGIYAGIQYQKELEKVASVAGGGKQKAPAQRVVDFLAHRESRETLPTSYFPGLTTAPLHELLPPPIVRRMKAGLRQFAAAIQGYTGPQGQLIGFETRTSSPLRIPRHPETLQHPGLAGLFPCGEGAGFAGGIVSAALDGLRCAEAACA